MPGVYIIVYNIEEANKSLENRPREKTYRTGKAVPIQRQNVVAFSMDVSALYPSVKKELATKAIREAIGLSKLEWKNIDTLQLSEKQFTPP